MNKIVGTLTPSLQKFDMIDMDQGSASKIARALPNATFLKQFTIVRNSINITAGNPIACFFAPLY